ncbi:MAG: Gfo/Idh/MocA family oxidoreductase [Solobacterium sp.]|nr:Gfo/Idh/MocA family oxidoreductase [Solobacterium sp.]
MKRIRFAVVGSGWRALYYIRAAQRLSGIFEICAVLCRSEEKAAYMAEKHHVPAVTSEEELISRNPEFVVVSVKKDAAADVVLKWMEKGFAVLAETPCALDRETVLRLREAQEKGGRLVIAEQYLRYPQMAAVSSLVRSGIIGEPSYLYLSSAHEYHAFSLMRGLLGIPCSMPFGVKAQTFEYPSVLTNSRYEEFRDGRTAVMSRTAAVFRFENGRTCLYDFDSDQYRSAIRSSHFRLQGERGEISDDEVRWLDEDNVPHYGRIHTEYRTVLYDDENPNLRQCREVTEISFRDRILYTPESGPAGLPEDETAVASLLKGMHEYASGGESPYPLNEALADAYAAILLREAAESGREAASESEYLKK